MKIPQEIVSFAKHGPAGQKLVEILSAAPEEGNEILIEVVGCFVEALREQAPSSKTGTMNMKSSEDLSKACSVVEQLMFLHPRGKQSLAFFSDRLVIQTSKQQIVMLSTDVTDVVVCVYDLKVTFAE